MEAPSSTSPAAPVPASSDSGSDSDSIWVRRLTFGKVKIKVEEEWGAGIGGTLWEGAVLMARWLSCESTFDKARWRGSRCIELGAGATGIPGILAAHLGCFRDVVITDIEECLERLRDNVAVSLPATANLREENPASTSEEVPAAMAARPAVSNGPVHAAKHDSIDSSAGWDGTTSVRVCELDWRQTGDDLRPPYDVVLVADVLYADELVDPLLATLVRLSTPKSLVAMAVYNRSERTSARFWERLPHYFSSYEKVPEKRFGSPPQPSHVGIFLLRR